MKMIRRVLSIAGVLIASVAVFANTRDLLTTLYFRAPDASSGTPGALCGVVISTPCPEGTAFQCADIFYTQLPGEAEPTPKLYYLSKSVDGGPCQIVRIRV